METQQTEKTFISIGVETIKVEARAIQALINRIDGNFQRACEIILATQGRVVILGMGKSGHVAKKIAATFASTGTPAFFVHPSEASHGDLGMIRQKDTVLAISNSGETKELITLLPLLLQIGIPIIGLSGKCQSTLGQMATVNLDVSVEQEACPLNLAPTSSTTATLVMGDALAIALQQVRGFTAHDFARHHPGGSLGNQLLLQVNNLMHTKNSIPLVSPEDTIKCALFEVSKKRLGMTTVIDANKRLLGVFTDGDLRRCMDDAIDLHTVPISQVIAKSPRTISPSTLAADALAIMNNDCITTLVVVDNSQRVLGIVHMHDILKAGIS